MHLGTTSTIAEEHLDHEQILSGTALYEYLDSRLTFFNIYPGGMRRVKAIQEVDTAKMIKEICLREIRMNL